MYNNHLVHSPAFQLITTDRIAKMVAMAGKAYFKDFWLLGQSDKSRRRRLQDAEGARVGGGVWGGNVPPPREIFSNVKKIFGAFWVFNSRYG